jgi:protein-disulfide isomerase
MDRFWDELRRHEYAPRIAEDVASADTSGVSGTPSFFINGRRHYGAYDIETLTAAVTAARNRAHALAAAV